MNEKVSRWDMGIIISDQHIPYHDKKANELMLSFVRREKPKYIFIDGDLIDCFMLSRFSKPPNIGRFLRDEFSAAKEYLTRLRVAAGNACEIKYIYGNHEFRLQKYIMDEAEELWGIDGLTVEDQLDLKHLKIEWIDSGLCENYYKWGALYIAHFDRVNKHSGYTARNLVDDKGACLVQAHTHRLGSSYKTILGNHVLVGYENGCLCNIHPNWIKDPNWQLGFSVVYQKRGHQRFHLQQIPIVDYRFFWGSHEYHL